MSKVVIQGNASGTGDFTIAAPNSNTNRTLTLPDEAGTIATTAFVTNRLVQNLNVTTGAVASGTNYLVADNTIPQITEGDQYMTLAITPTSATSLLEISITAVLEVNAAAQGGLLLFRDAVSDALATVFFTMVGNRGYPVSFTHRMTAGTTSEIIFRVRGAGDNGTMTFNGFNTLARHGGRIASGITIKEYAS
jgi:hypothetical protein